MLLSCHIILVKHDILWFSKILGMSYNLGWGEYYITWTKRNLFIPWATNTQCFCDLLQTRWHQIRSHSRIRIEHCFQWSSISPWTPSREIWYFCTTFCKNFVVYIRVSLPGLISNDYSTLTLTMPFLINPTVPTSITEDLPVLDLSRRGAIPGRTMPYFDRSPNIKSAMFAIKRSTIYCNWYTLDKCHSQTDQSLGHYVYLHSNKIWKEHWKNIYPF